VISEEILNKKIVGWKFDQLKKKDSTNREESLILDGLRIIFFLSFLLNVRKGVIKPDPMEIILQNKNVDF